MGIQLKSYTVEYCFLLGITSNDFFIGSKCFDKKITPYMFYLL